MSNKIFCRYCKQELNPGTSHQCSQMANAGHSSRVANEDDGDFFVSAAVAAVSDDWFIGAIVGGDIAGAVVGDMFFGGDDGSGYDLDSDSDIDSGFDWD